MSATFQTSRALDQGNIGPLSGEISGLMVCYCDSIEACRSIPALSIRPALKIFLLCFTWPLFLEICIVLVPIDLALFLVRGIFGRPRFVIGRVVYAYVLRPFRSVWDGEISAFAVFRLRYLSRLLLFYHAQSRINVLHRVFNRRHLDALVANPSNDIAVVEAETFQKTFDLFQKITTDSYQIGALAIGGPLVALLSLAVQQVLIPAANFLWTYLGRSEVALSDVRTLGAFGIIFVALTMWILVSAWMEMRSILANLGVPKIERNVFVYAGIKEGRQLPFDLLFYIALMGFICWAIYHSIASATDADIEFLGTMFVTIVVTLYGLLCLGLVALFRRLWLSWDNAPRVDIKLLSGEERGMGSSAGPSQYG